MLFSWRLLTDDQSVRPSVVIGKIHTGVLTILAVAGWYGTRLCGCPPLRPSAANSSLMPLRRAQYQPALRSAATTHRPISSQPACRTGLSGWRSDIKEEQSVQGLFGARTNTNNNANTVR